MYIYIYIYIWYHPKTHTFSEFADICDVLLFISMFKRLDFWSLINGKEFDYRGRVEFKESLVNKEELYQKKRCLVRVIKNLSNALFEISRKPKTQNFLGSCLAPTERG